MKPFSSAAVAQAFAAYPPNILKDALAFCVSAALTYHRASKAKATGCASAGGTARRRPGLSSNA